MTTKIADIYDAIITLVSTELPTYARIPNPYAIDENTALFLKRSYGLAIGAGVNTERYVGCHVTWQRSYTLNLITQVVNTENDTTGRASVEKDLIDAHRLILMAFETDSTLGGNCIKAVVTDDSGIQYIEGQDGKFLAVEISLAVEYQENLT
jgi:hypothetical protein